MDRSIIAKQLCFIWEKNDLVFDHVNQHCSNKPMNHPWILDLQLYMYSHLHYFNFSQLINKFSGQFNYNGTVWFMIDHRSYTHNLSTCEIKAWKNSGLDGIRTHDLCHTGAVLYRLSHHYYYDFNLAWKPSYCITISL